MKELHCIESKIINIMTIRSVNAEKKKMQKADNAIQRNKKSIYNFVDFDFL